VGNPLGLISQNIKHYQTTGKFEYPTLENRQDKLKEKMIRAYERTKSQFNADTP
jgi:hypothetical protein